MKDIHRLQGKGYVLGQHFNRAPRNTPIDTVNYNQKGQYAEVMRQILVYLLVGKTDGATEKQ